MKILVKVLGIGDLLTGVLFWATSMFNVSESLLMIGAFYLLGKGLFFVFVTGLTSIASYIDIACSIIIFINFTANVPFILKTAVVIFLVVKGIASLF